MRRPLVSLARLRPAAAPVSLAVYLLAALAAPIGHLATHRNDHTHGPEAGDGHAHPVHRALDDHARAHALGLDHDHDHDHDDHGDDHDQDHDQDDDRDLDHGDHDRDTPAAPAQHGEGSVAHFGLALIEGPPPPFLPPPAETLALPSAAPVRSHVAPALPQPPARGPPSHT